MRRPTLPWIPATGIPYFLNLAVQYAHKSCSEIEANINLVAPSRRPAARINHPSFLAHVKTFNSPLTLDVYYEPSSPGVPLQLYTQNNLANTNITLDSKFQGTFSVSNKASLAIVTDAEDAGSLDPSGFQRPRTLIYDQNSTTVQRGWVGWGKKPANAGQGCVEIVSSLGPARLFFGPQ